MLARLATEKKGCSCMKTVTTYVFYFLLCSCVSWFIAYVFTTIFDELNFQHATLMANVLGLLVGLLSVAILESARQKRKQLWGSRDRRTHTASATILENSTRRCPQSSFTLSQPPIMF